MILIKEIFNYLFYYFKLFASPFSRNSGIEDEFAASPIIVWTIEPTRTGTYQISRNGRIVSADYPDISAALKHVPRDQNGVVGFGNKWEDYYEE
jgi:hypothetical protein